MKKEEELRIKLKKHGFTKSLGNFDKLMGNEKEICVMCGSKEVVYEVGSKQKATLNETDYTSLINAQYDKGDKLCVDCLFK